MGFYYGNDFYGLSIYNKKTKECVYKQSFTDMERIDDYKIEVTNVLDNLDSQNIYDFMVLTTCTCTLDGLNNYISVQPIPGTPVEFKELLGKNFNIDIILKEKIPNIF